MLPLAVRCNKRQVQALLLVGVLIMISGANAHSGTAQKEISVIPRPEYIENRSGEFEITRGFVIQVITGNNTDDQVVDAVLNIGEYFADQLNSVADLAISVHQIGEKQPGERCLTLELADSMQKLGPEGYQLVISTNKITLKARDAAGLFYGVQTLLQLLPADVYTVDNKAEPVRLALPCLRIEDRPRFEYRGMHLDSCRHFFPVSFVKRYIDLLAMHKINTFHWHLTEDQGWRIEIKKYPLLTEIGSIRAETPIRRTGTFDGEPYGGYYTQDEIREVVAYAEQKYITVIPEIEMPGHSVAALTAYPDLSCTGGPFEVRTRWGISRDIYCAGNDRVFEFLEDILSEVMDMFPSRYIHIGGDEAPKERWKKCSKCQARIAKEGLADEHELQSYFIKRIEDYLNAHGRQLIGWDEILEGGLAPDATVMSWRGTIGGIEAARQSHDVIMTPNSHLYFDGYQADPAIEPFAIGYWAPLEKVYGFEPVPTELTEKQSKHVIGAQANLWTEYIATEQYAEYMLLPRLDALSEVTWTPRDLRDWGNFEQRLQKQYLRYQNLGVEYRIPTPDIEPVVILEKGAELAITPGTRVGTIHYTTDGTEPGANTTRYEEPVVIAENTTIKACTVLDGGRNSSAITTTVLIKQSAPEGKLYGLHYDYYESDDFDRDLPELLYLEPQSSGYVKYLSPDALKHRDDLYSILFTGYLVIKQAGTYIFHMLGNDGSKLLINGELVCGTKSWVREAVTGTLELETGLAPIEIQYHEWRGSDRLQLFYEGPGIEKQIIPADRLCVDKP